MIDFIQGKRNLILALAIMFVVVSLSGTTYSLFFQSEVTNSFTYSTGLLELQISEDKQIVLSNVFPTIDSEGMTSTPYQLTIKNTGNIPYLFDLKMLSSTEENTIDSKYIKVMVDNNRPSTLYTNSGIIADDVIIYPNEERIFSVRVWLDYNTPNQELGKTFVSKFATTGESIYKTLDNSNANPPELIDGMFPIHYNDQTKSWEKAAENNMSEDHLWYDYNDSQWANVVTIKNSPKQIYDIIGNHHITVDEITSNNRNIILGDHYLDLGVPYNSNTISNIIRVKFDNLNADKIYLIANNRITYYYDTKLSKFGLQIGNTTVFSSTYNLEENNWYILGYTYNGQKVSYYINGNKLSTANISADITTTSTFKLGTNNSLTTYSNITVGDVYIYDRILSDSEIATNYKTSISIIYDSLVAGYNEFYPMTLNEYYQSAPPGTPIRESDILSYYVWIPRFKYKVWNVTGKSLTPNYNSQSEGIEIAFEEGTTSSGMIYCQKGICYSDNLMITKVTATDNDKYYTHPAFTNTDSELTGFWVSKYELSNPDNPQAKPGNNVVTNRSLSAFYQSIKAMDKTINYHMIKNTDWGAITYLAHSQYGVCKKTQCQAIPGNQTYISGNEPLDTTTRNIYGVYDMAGSASEFVMGNYADEFGNLSITNFEFQNIAISNNDYDLYYPNTFILGDATLEVTIENNSWDNGIANFINQTNNWFVRGGIARVENDSIFSYRASSNIISEYISTRIVIK